jgi:3-hydroxy-3-methylglutaryl CoA synthase
MFTVCFSYPKQKQKQQQQQTNKTEREGRKKNIKE